MFDLTSDSRLGRAKSHLVLALMTHTIIQDVVSICNLKNTTPYPKILIALLISFVYLYLVTNSV